MKIKTFPLQFTEEYLDKIRKAASDSGMTIKSFILEAISSKLEGEDGQSGRD